MLKGYILLKETPDYENNDEIVALLAKMEPLLLDGYVHLQTFKLIDSDGYEWFGKSPASEPLTAYALSIMKTYKIAFPDLVEASLIPNIMKWLLSRKDGSNGFLQSKLALDTFGRAPLWTANAYILNELASNGVTPSDIDEQITGLIAHADKLIAAAEVDTYELTLLASALFELDRSKEAKYYADIVKSY
jgi:hypothetical protein